LTTVEVPGRTATVRVVTDYSVESWGFAIDKVLFQ
jgi:hypothetical protein